MVDEGLGGSSLPDWDPVSATQVAGELMRFVERVLVTLEGALAQALAAEALNMSEVRLMMALERGGLSDATLAVHIDGARGMRHQLRSLAHKGLVEVADGALVSHAASLTSEGHRALRQLESASRAALTELIAGLDASQRLRLQGAMHLISDRFSPGAVPFTDRSAQ